MKTIQFSTKAEICRAFKIKERTLNGWMKRRIIPFYKFGRSVRFNPEEVQERVAQLRVGGRIRSGA